MTDKNNPIYHPISMLETITFVLDGEHESAVDQLDSLLPVMDKPYVLDSNTIERIITLYTEQAEDHQFFVEQLNRWEKESLNVDQLNEVNRLKKVLDKTKVVGSKILDITNEMKGNSIDDILGMDETELALKVLTGQIKPPF